MEKSKDFSNIDVKTRRVQGIILKTLYDLRNKDSPGTDLGMMRENAVSELLYFADAISILREELFITAPSYGYFRITDTVF